MSYNLIIYRIYLTFQILSNPRNLVYVKISKINFGNTIICIKNYKNILK